VSSPACAVELALVRCAAVAGRVKGRSGYWLTPLAGVPALPRPRQRSATGVVWVDGRQSARERLSGSPVCAATQAGSGNFRDDEKKFAAGCDLHGL